MGLLSLDSLKLKIKIEVGTPAERSAAQKILPVLSNHHLLLCTLLLFNAVANEALPIFLDALVPSWAAVVISVTLVLICGEVLPSALFTGPNQLQIAAKFIGLVYFLEIIFYPIAYPMGKMLDYVLGHEDDDNFSRDEISALVKIMRTKGTVQIKDYFHVDPHSDRASIEFNQATTVAQLSGGEVLSAHEADVITGVLGLTKITVKDVCKPMSKVAMLSTEQLLDRETIDIIDKVGFSRLPVFKGYDMTHILGYLIVKRLINCDLSRGIPVSSVRLTEPVVVGAKQNLLEVMKIFQSGHRHMALVSEKPRELTNSIRDGVKPSLAAAPIGIITAEDVFEQMIQAQIIDEEDRDKSMLYESASSSLREMSMRSSTPSYSFLENTEVNTRGSRALSTTLFGLNFTGKDPSMNEPLIDPNEEDSSQDNNEESMAYSFLKNKGMTPSLVASYRKNNTASNSTPSKAGYQ